MKDIVSEEDIKEFARLHDEGKTLHEIAEETGFSYGTVQKRLYGYYEERVVEYHKEGMDLSKICREVKKSRGWIIDRILENHWNGDISEVK